jgi:hypothetical protein
MCSPALASPAPTPGHKKCRASSCVARAADHEILRAVGAHSTIDVDLGCRSGDLIRHANVRLTLAAPVEATEERSRSH